MTVETPTPKSSEGRWLYLPDPEQVPRHFAPGAEWEEARQIGEAIDMALDSVS